MTTGKELVYTSMRKIEKFLVCTICLCIYAVTYIAIVVGFLGTLGGSIYVSLELLKYLCG